MISQHPICISVWYERKSMNPSKTQHSYVRFSFSMVMMLGAFTPKLPLKKGFRISIPPRIFMKHKPKYSFPRTV